jgi:hypothetical protein
MFRKSLFLSAARIDELGQYQSPNVCFISPDEDEFDGGQDDQDAGADTDEEAGEGEESGDEADGGEGEEGEEVADHEEGDEQEGRHAQVARGESPRRRGASEIIRENKRAAKELREELVAERKAREALERRMEQQDRDRDRQRSTETAEQERLRLDTMTTEERYDYQLQKREAAHRQEMEGVKFQIWDSSDRAAFRELVREDPLVAKVKDKVEAEYERLRSQGRPVEREIIANQEIAKMMRQQRSSAGTKQKARGAEQVRRATTKPVQGRGDVAPQRSRRGQEDTPEARRRRLEGVTI